MALSVLALAAVACSLLYAVHLIHRYIQRRTLMKQRGCQPAPTMAHLDPILGFDTMMESYTHISKRTYLNLTRSRFAQYGNTYWQCMTGSRMLNTCDPANIQAILTSQFQSFSLGERRKAAFIPLLGRGIFTSDGAPWSHSRTLLRPSFARDRVGDMPVLERHISDLISAIKLRQSETGSVDLKELFFCLTLDIATELFCGESCNSLKARMASLEADGKDARFAEAFNRGQQKIAEDWALGPLKALRYWKRSDFNDDKDAIYTFVDRYVKRAVTESKRRKSVGEKTAAGYVVLEEMAKQTHDVTQLRSDLLNLMVAGRDTTASLLSNLFFVLARRQDVWQQLKEEIQQVEASGEQLDFAKLKDMKYLQGCLKESLRMHPPIPRNSRTAERDVVLPRGGGSDGKSPLFIPAGTIVGYSAYCMHRRDDLWEDPDTFKPERWDGMRTGWEYVPFNGGPRMCLGQQLALTEAAYTAARLIQAFPDITACGEWDYEEHLTITLAPKDCTISFTPESVIPESLTPVEAGAQEQRAAIAVPLDSGNAIAEVGSPIEAFPTYEEDDSLGELPKPVTARPRITIPQQLTDSSTEIPTLGASAPSQTVASPTEMTPSSPVDPSLNLSREAFIAHAVARAAVVAQAASIQTAAAFAGAAISPPANQQPKGVHSQRFGTGARPTPQRQFTEKKPVMQPRLSRRKTLKEICFESEMSYALQAAVAAAG